MKSMPRKKHVGPTTRRVAKEPALERKAGIVDVVRLYRGDERS